MNWTKLVISVLLEAAVATGVSLAQTIAPENISFRIVKFEMKPEQVHPGDRIDLILTISAENAFSPIPQAYGVVVAWLDDEPHSFDSNWRGRKATSQAELGAFSAGASTKQVKLTLKAPETLGNHKLEPIIYVYASNRHLVLARQRSEGRDTEILSIPFTVEARSLSQSESPPNIIGRWRNVGSTEGTYKIIELVISDRTVKRTMTNMHGRPEVRETHYAFKPGSVGSEWWCLLNLDSPTGSAAYANVRVITDPSGQVRMQWSWQWAGDPGTVILEKVQ